MTTYQAKVRVPYCGTGRLIVDVIVMAQNTTQARALLQAQYGPGNLITLPIPVQT